MPYKDPLIRKQKARERKHLWIIQRREKRIKAGLLSDGRGKHGNHRRGMRHYRWNNGRMIDQGGYVKVRVGRSHPLADSNGYMHEHLLVWVLSGNPPPAPDELIHHKDENKEHNKINNFDLKQRSRHNAEHNAKRFGRRIITEKDVVDMRKRREQGEKLISIAVSFDIAFQTVSKIVRGQQYPKAGGPIQRTLARTQNSETGKFEWKSMDCP